MLPQWTVALTSPATGLNRKQAHGYSALESLLKLRKWLMDRISWKSTSGLALAAMVCLMAAPASAGIVYNVTNYAAGQSGWKLAGTITVLEYGTTADGSKITAFDLTASKDLVNHRYNGSDVYLSGFISAGPTRLILPYGTLRFTESGSAQIGWYNGSGQDYYAVWDNSPLWSSGAYSPIVDSTLLLGTPVPEIDPAGIGSVLALVTGALGLLERRRLKTA